MLNVQCTWNFQSFTGIIRKFWEINVFTRVDFTGLLEINSAISRFNSQSQCSVEIKENLSHYLFDKNFVKATFITNKELITRNISFVRYFSFLVFPEQSTRKFLQCCGKKRNSLTPLRLFISNLKDLYSKMLWRKNFAWL